MRWKTADIRGSFRPEADGPAAASVGETVFAQSLKFATRIDVSIIRLVTNEVILDRRRHRIAGYDSYVMGNAARKLEPEKVAVAGLGRCQDLA